jgi:ribosomal protein L11 methyltransferase
MDNRRHYRLRLTVTDPAQSDMLTGLLSTMGFSGFEEAEDGLYAYAEEGAFDVEEVDLILNRIGITYCGSWIEPENWNALWESSFEPVVIPDKVVVRADFHPSSGGAGLEIVITPRMSFGTGHHATTWLMLSEMADLDLDGKDVLDFGSGTGILAIMAEKKGARAVDAIDNDPGCISNAGENIAVNGCHRIRTMLSDSVPEGQTYDVVVANINRNVIVAEARRMANVLRPGGNLLLSGLLQEDGPAVEEAFFGLIGKPASTRGRGGWILMSYVL